MREALHRLLADQVQHDRDVVRAEAPQRVLVGAQLAEVQAVAVDVVQRRRARRASISSFRRATAGWYSSRWPTISILPGLARPRRRARSASAALVASGFSTKQCLPARATRDRELGVRRHGRGEHDRVELGVVEQLARARPSCARAGKRARQRARAPARRRRTASAARSRRSRRSCGRGSGPSSRGPTTPTRTGSLAAARSALTASPIACTQRSAAWPSPYSCGRSAGGVALERRERRAARRGRRACSSRPRTVSTHSVLARSVTQGTPARYASFWTPPESVSTARAWHSSALNST